MQEQDLSLDVFRQQFREVSGTEVSERQAYRWLVGEVRKLPYPHARVALEKMFREPAKNLLGPPLRYPSAVSSIRAITSEARRDYARNDWEGQLISMSADRARDFMAKAETTNVGPGTIDQLADDVRRLALASQEQPFPSLLEDLVEVQERAFGLLDGRQKPEQTRELYLLAGILSGFLSKASHDAGASHEALTHARAAYACADNAGHDGLRAWVRGLQALITYWAGRFADSVRYAQLGTEAAERSRGTAAVWLASSEARSLAALTRLPEAHAALSRASDARDRVGRDELDELGGICTFSRPTQLYYVADALVWGGVEEAARTEQVALEALDALDEAPLADRGGFGNEQGTRCNLAVARLVHGELEGAIEAVTPVLELPREQRQRGIVGSLERVQRTLSGLPASERDNHVRSLTESIETFMTHRLALPQ